MRRRVFLAAILAPALFSPPASCAPSLQRYLSSLKLGDTIKEIEEVYPPKAEWAKEREPDRGLDRILIERDRAKWFPAQARVVRLGMKRGRLVHLQIIYNKEYSRAKSLEELVGDYSLIYGEPRRRGGTYFWWDAETVLALSNAEIKAEKGVELRASVELMDKGYFPALRK